MANIIGIVGFVLTGVALLFAILACALPYWTVVDGSLVDANFGLWRRCTTINDNTDCTSITKDNTTDEGYDDLNVVKAMVLLGLLLLIPGLVVGILVLFLMKDKKILFFIAGAINIVAGLFLMVGFAYYTAELHDDDNDDASLGAAFALDIVAWILAWVAGALFIVAKIMDKD